MDNPKLYARTNQLQQKEVREFLTEYIHLVRWKRDGSGRALDIGCGPGDITVQILLPMLPESVQELVATDLSPHMIQYARSHQQHPQVSYDVLDIGTKKLPKAYCERFDQVFSHYCLHWIQDQRQAMKNIFDMLQSGGDVLLLYLSKHPTFEVSLKLASLEHWKPYMEEYRRYDAPYQNVENVDKLLYSLLQEVGYVNITCECRRKEYLFENINTLTDAMTAVNPYIKQLPEHLNERYRQELCREHKIQACTEGYINNETGSITLPYTLIMIHARKP